MATSTTRPLAPSSLSRMATRTSGLQDLTPRELETLALVAEGRSNADIAATLVLTKRAVEKVIRKAFFKTHFYEGMRVPYVANPRIPSSVVDELPESVVADDLTMGWLLDTIEELKNKAKLKLS